MLGYFSRSLLRLICISPLFLESADFPASI